MVNRLWHFAVLALIVVVASHQTDADIETDAHKVADLTSKSMAYLHPQLPLLFLRLQASRNSKSKALLNLRGHIFSHHV